MDSEPRSAAWRCRPVVEELGARATGAGGDLDAGALDAGNVTRLALAALGERSFGRDGLNGRDGLRTAKRCMALQAPGANTGAGPAALARELYKPRDARTGTARFGPDPMKSHQAHQAHRAHRFTEAAKRSMTLRAVGANTAGATPRRFGLILECSPPPSPAAASRAPAPPSSRCSRLRGSRDRPRRGRAASCARASRE